MKKILVIDDEPQILQMVSSRLEANGYAVVTAFSGKRGMELAGKELPNLILLDHVMSGLDGDAVLGLLKKDPITKPIPVVLFTADIKRVKAGEYKLLGAEDCLFKPFLSEELLSVIQRILDRKA